MFHGLHSAASVSSLSSREPVRVPPHPFGPSSLPPPRAPAYIRSGPRSLVVQRPLASLVLALVLSLGLAGCTSAPAEPGDERSPEGADGGDGATDGPFKGLAPGVRQAPLPAGADAIVGGHVYDTVSGFPIDDALVLVTCFRAALPGTDSPQTDRRFADVAPDGSFALDDPLGFVDCQRVEYTIQAAGYTMKIPLSTGPLLPGVAYQVYGGMVPAE